MMKFFIYLFSLCVSLVLLSCDDEDTLTPSEEALFPARQETELDKSLKELFGPYNTVIEYRYVENYLPSDWYSITPVLEEKVLPAMTFMKKMWIDVLVAGSSEQFVRDHFPRMLLLVGSPALKRDGTEVLGEAEGGTLIRFTRLNDFEDGNLKWARQQLTTAFHEYAHILHQTFNMPDEYRQVTPNNYSKNGWLIVSDEEAVSRGMVTPYGTSAVSEDFAEMFANYVLLSEDEWNYLCEEQALPAQSTPNYVSKLQEVLAMNTGRGYIRKKFAVLKKFLLENGLDVDKTRKAAQEKLSTLN